MKNKLSRSIVYSGFRKALVSRFGQARASEIWNDANEVFLSLEQRKHQLDSDSRLMILPAAALYTALAKHAPEQALPLLIDYATQVGEKIAWVVHSITSFPGLPKLLWHFMPQLMRITSSTKKGYTRRIVSETSELVGVDILSCPLHNAAVKIGVPEAALVVCAMDKAYMTGFRHIHYTRTTSVAEGSECCDYRLSYDKNKK